jgi:hypothetical protein
MNNYLLVPTNVQAFLVGQTADPPTNPLYDLAPVPRTTDDLIKWYGDRKYAFSFQSSKCASPLQPGLHLHWALPEALMHTRHEAGKPPVQPCIPNRWLVRRLCHAEGNPNISSKAWVVESDYVSDTAQFGGSPFLFFSPSLAVKYVGRTVPLEQWQETQSVYRFELTASGWGDPSFAAYYPACKGVLGFHDKMEGVPPGNQLTYLIMGWYSDQTKDPLGTGDGSNTVESFKARLAGLEWLCPDVNGAPLPQRTLCHGAVVGITWQGAAQSYPSAPAGATPPTVVIGGSAAEALAALVARHAPETNDVTDKDALEKILCAFQHGQAMQVTDYHQLVELLHQHSFNALAGGTHWSMEPTRSTEAQRPVPSVSEPILKRLGELNQAQQRHDRHVRKIESLRWQLFACWATWASKQNGPPPRRPSRDPVISALEKLNQAVNELPPLQQAVDRCKTTLNAVLTGEQTGLQLVESTMPPFLHPKDPFVVLTGENLIGPSRMRAERDHQDAGRVLRCRTTTAVVTGVNQSGTISRVWSADQHFSLPGFQDVAGTGLGDLARELAIEALLFDPSCSGMIPTADDRLFKALQKSLNQSRQSDVTTLTWIGQTPDSLAVTPWGNTNPWLPVYLMWQARWTSAYAPGQDSDDRHSKSLDGWQFSSDALSCDLVLRGVPPKSADTPLVLEDATILSPLSGSQLAEHLREFGKAIGHDADNLAGIEQTEVLGQSLGGFTDQLLRQTLGLCLPPVDPTNGQVEVDASVWEAMGKGTQPTMPGARAFLPVRTGAVTLVNLYLVDTFGQVRKLIDSSHAEFPQANMIVSAVLAPSSREYHARFSPRLSQPARLNFAWQAADESASGPVCGWMVPNFLEKSFALFSAKGDPLGALESVLPALGEKTIRSPVTFAWRPIPGSSLGINDIVNERLRRFVELVANFTADEGQAFLELVELVLRKTEARLPPEDPALAVLLGRPLALVQASLELELRGLSAGYWNSNWKFDTEGLERLQVPVRLGGMALPADGLVGYLPEDGRPRLVASDGATRRLGGSGCITYDQQLSVACAGAPLKLTLLMDASARVHASTGILPRHHIQLPEEVGKQLGLIEKFYVSVAPVLGVPPGESAAQPTMPRPSDAFGQWSWATRPSVAWRAIKSADDRARFADGLTLSEGWLELRVKHDQRDAAPDKEA